MVSFESQLAQASECCDAVLKTWVSVLPTLYSDVHNIPVV